MCSQSSKIIFHIDVNSAFLSWSAVEEMELARREGREVIDLRTIPSIVGGDVKQRRGIVTAASIPAKKRGIHTAQTVVDAFRLCPELVSVKSDFGLYRFRSRELMDFLREYSPVLEKVSIDECFLDATALTGRSGAAETACAIKDRIREKFGYTVNIGISSNKILAKMASDFEKPDKVHTLFPDEIEQKMWPLPIRELFMAGRASASKLENLGIATIGDLAKSDPVIIEGHLKSHGRTLWEYANGIANDKVNPVRDAAKSESVERTLSRDLVDLEDAFVKINEVCRQLAGRLHNHGFRASEAAIIIKYSDFTSTTHQKKLIGAVSSDTDLAQAACELFEEAWDGRPVRLIGVRAGKLEDVSDPIQMSLADFAKEKKEAGRRNKADEAAKKLREKYGDSIISKGIKI